MTPIPGASIKIAHVTTVDMSLRYLLLGQLRALATDGYEVVGISSPGSDVAAVEAAGIRHIAVPMTRRFTPFADVVSLVRLVRVMRRERFTIVHTHTPKPGLLGQLAARIARVPVVVNTIHGYYFHDATPRLARRFYILMEKLAARCSDAILSQNREDIDTAVRERICHPELIGHLGNGIDLSRFDPARVNPRAKTALRGAFGIPADAPVVGFVGRLVAEKGLPELFQTVASLRGRFPALRLLIVGPLDRDKRDALGPETAGRYNVADRCVFTGMRHDMPELYSLMDVLALPSHREGFPRAPMEASAMGVPCIVTNIRGCREVVEPGRNGLLVPAHDPVALAAALANILGDTALARRLGENGRIMARERFDERHVVDNVRATYARLLAARASAEVRS